MFDAAGAPNVRALFKESLPASIAGVCAPYVKRSFVPDINVCCTKALRVRKMQATVIEVDDCFSTWHVVKTCTGGCGAVYYVNKRVIHEVIGEKRCRWHLFYPWSDGRIPEYITSS